VNSPIALAVDETEQEAVGRCCAETETAGSRSRFKRSYGGVALSAGNSLRHFTVTVTRLLFLRSPGELSNAQYRKNSVEKEGFMGH